MHKECLFMSHYLNTINSNQKIVQILDSLKSVWTPDDYAFRVLQQVSIYMDLQYRVFVVATDYQDAAAMLILQVLSRTQDSGQVHSKYSALDVTLSESLFSEQFHKALSAN